MLLFLLWCYLYLHMIIEELRREGTSGECLVQSPSQCRITESRLRRTPFSWVLKTSKDGDWSSFCNGILYILSPGFPCVIFVCTSRIIRIKDHIVLLPCIVYSKTTAFPKTLQLQRRLGLAKPHHSSFYLCQNLAISFFC